jgi:hypothetical protein
MGSMIAMPSGKMRLFCTRRHRGRESISKGYGESVLVNGCRDGVKCPEDAHQLNRRTEFKVIKKVMIEEVGSGM